jgi:serine protease Do
MRSHWRHSRKAVFVAILTAALLLGLSTGSAGAAGPSVTPGERVRALVEPSIVYVSTQFSGLAYDKVNGHLVRRTPFLSTAACSGFFVSPSGDVITAAHCVEKGPLSKYGLASAAAQWTTTHNYYQNPFLKPKDVVGDYDVRGIRSITTVAYGVSASADTASGTARRAVLKGIRSYSQEAGDVALLKMLNVQDVPALKVVADAQVETLEDVWSVGYPAKVDYVVDDTFEPSFKDGSISSKKTRFDIPVYELSSAIAGGMSGGPTVDAEGNVIGVNSFGSDASTEAFNFVQTAATVNDLLADKNVNNVFGETNTTYREGIEAYIDGDRDAAIDRFQSVLTDVPNHSLAREYLRKSEILPKSGGGIPGWGYVLIALGVLVVLAAAFYALVRSGTLSFKRPRRPARARVETLPPGPTKGRTMISPRPGEPTLVIQQGPGAGQRFTITSDMMLGREEADINLDDAEVSRRHAMIRPVNGKLEVFDLRSANGTRVNGSLVDGTATLADGDTIEVGRTTLAVEMPAKSGSSGPETATNRRPEDA